MLPATWFRFVHAHPAKTSSEGYAANLGMYLIEVRSNYLEPPRSLAWQRPELDMVR
jgi:hypothetical protein